MAIFVQVLIVLALTGLNAFFAAAELSILSVRRSRLRELANEGRVAAKSALDLRSDPERFLATVQVGITVVGTAAGAFGGAVLREPIARALRPLGVGAAAEDVAFAIVVCLVSVATVVLGELVPKSLALRSPERVALLVSRPLLVLARLSGPTICLLTTLSNVVLRPFKDRTTFIEARLSREELHELLDEATAVGTVDRQSGDIASRAIDLGGLRTYSVMTPRSKVVWLGIDAGRDEVLRVLRATPHARYPVLDAGGQDAIGYVLAHDLYRQLLDGDLGLTSLVRPIPVVSEVTPAVVALRTLQQARCEIGIVVEEHGSIAGIVSIETLAEELFGAIVSENETERVSIARGDDGTFLVRGETPLHQLNRELGVELPIDSTASTIGGLVLSANGGFPTCGTVVPLPGGGQAEVVGITGQRVASVRLTFGAGGPDLRPRLVSGAELARSARTSEVRYGQVRSRDH